ncbi:TPA: hypothetical protein ACJJKL_002177, partial [Neisseria meningitidis]
IENFLAHFYASNFVNRLFLQRSLYFCHADISRDDKTGAKKPDWKIRIGLFCDVLFDLRTNCRPERPRPVWQVGFSNPTAI